MNEHVLWSKIARIIMQLADTLNITSERAMTLFYESDVCAMLHEPKFGLHLMSDTYIVNDIIREWQMKQGQFPFLIRIPHSLLHHLLIPE